MSNSSARKITVEFIGKDTSLGKTTSTLSSKMQTAGKIAGRALAGGALIAAGGLYKMGQAAAADEAAAAKLSTALKNNAGATDATIASTEKWITAQGKALGVTDDELRPAIARLVTATHDVGKAQDLASLAMDVSAGSGKSLEAVSTALMKAQNGQVSSLARLGINTKNAAGETISMDEATKRMAKTFGGQAAKAAETTAGKQKRLQVTLSELGESIGAVVLPAMVKLSEIGLKMVGWVDKNRTTVAVLVGTLAGLAAVTWAVGAAIKAWAAITKVATAVQVVWTNATWAFAIAQKAAMGPIGLAIMGIAALIAVVVLIEKKTGFFSKAWKVAWRSIKSAFSSVFDFIKTKWPLILAILTGPIGIAVYAIAKHWDKIKAGVSVVKGFIVDKFNALVGFFQKLPGRISNVASGLFDGVKNAFKDAINWIIQKWNDFEISMPSVNTHIPGIGTVGGFSLGTPNIPYLAKGGIVSRPTLAMIGEAGPEAVVPLSGPNARSMGGPRQIVFTGPVYGDPRAFARWIAAELRKEKSASGVALGLA